MIAAAALACTLGACGKQSVPEPAAATQPAVTAVAAPGDACDALRMRIQACFANMKQGHLELEFDPAKLSDPAQCAEIDRKFGLLAATVHCENPQP